ncbi:MAG: hypothetical protein GX627_01355 [Parcubacteria group bacterium]|jgi:hypothetical protein|nr:hypothetical protein [Parcubacteria group bacterium]
MNQDSLFKQYKGVFESKEKVARPENENLSRYAYNPFALQDALGEKDKKKIWIEYVKLRLQGVKTEEIIHIVISKIKNMSAISAGAKKENLGLKDYPYNKSKRDVKNWSEIKLKDFYNKLVFLYHESRGARLNGYSDGENKDLDTVLEKILLQV